MSDRTPGELADALEKALEEKYALMEETYADDMEQICDASMILQDALTAGTTALRKMEGTSIRLVPDKPVPIAGSMIQRLADKRREGPTYFNFEDEARWWLNAIADELEDAP